MITEDDAPNTFELSDRYVIEPSFHFWSRTRETEGAVPVEAKPVPKGFRYASDINSDWLDEDRLRKLLAEPH